MKTRLQMSPWEAALLSAGLIAVFFVLREYWGHALGLASTAE
jgi:hypothetical protein